MEQTRAKAMRDLQRLAAAIRAHEATLAQRDDVIRNAHEAGIRAADISEIVGLGHARVYQIVKERAT